MIAKNDTIEIGSHVFMHNNYAPILTSENIELFNENYIAICLCAKTADGIEGGIDIPKELSTKLPTTEWMQLDPTYAFCTVGMMTDIRILRDKGAEGSKMMVHVLNSFFNFIFKDVCGKHFTQLQETEVIKSDIRQSIFEHIGLHTINKKQAINWDKELTKLMGGKNEEKNVE